MAHHINWIEWVLFLVTIIGTVVGSTIYIERCNAEQNTRLENHEVRITKVEEDHDVTISLLNQILEYEKGNK